MGGLLKSHFTYKNQSQASTETHTDNLTKMITSRENDIMKSAEEHSLCTGSFDSYHRMLSVSRRLIIFTGRMFEPIFSSCRCLGTIQSETSVEDRDLDGAPETVLPILSFSADAVKNSLEKTSERTILTSFEEKCRPFAWQYIIAGILCLIRCQHNSWIAFGRLFFFWNALSGKWEWLSAKFIFCFGNRSYCSQCIAQFFPLFFSQEAYDSRSLQEFLFLEFATLNVFFMWSTTYFHHLLCLLLLFGSGCQL